LRRSAVSCEGHHSPGAQTERRGGAGPVRGLLGGKDPTGRFLCGQLSDVSRTRQETAATDHGQRTTEESSQKSPAESTSPPQRVLRACSVDSGVLSLRKGTEPSAKAKLAPPGWPLPKAQRRSSTVAKAPPCGTR